MSTESATSRKFLGGLSNLFNRRLAENSSSQAQPQKFKQQADELNSALNQLKSKIESRRAETSKVAATASPDGTGTKTAGFKLKVSSPEEIQRELEVSQKSLNQTIAALHKQLDTSFDETRLSELHERCLEILENIKGSDTDARIRREIAERVFREVAPYSWQILNQLMQRKNIKWDLPDSISANLTEDEINRNIQSRMGEIEDIFCNQTLKQGVEMLTGQISAWKRYPYENSWLWKEVSLRAVGTAIRDNLFIEAIEKIREAAPTLRSNAEELMRENLSQIDEMLGSGLQSIEQAETLVASGDRIIKEILPELAWDMVDEYVQKRASEMLER